MSCWLYRRESGLWFCCSFCSFLLFFSWTGLPGREITSCWTAFIFFTVSFHTSRCFQHLIYCTTILTLISATVWIICPVLSVLILKGLNVCVTLMCIGWPQIWEKVKGVSLLWNWAWRIHTGSTPDWNIHCFEKDDTYFNLQSQL